MKKKIRICLFFKLTIWQIRCYIRKNGNINLPIIHLFTSFLNKNMKDLGYDVF